MPTIDDNLIHAYVDDELDPESRLLVEQEAQADPRVAHALDELARLHGLMSNVHRPPDLPDVSGAVVATLNRAEARRRALQPIASSTILALAALLMVTYFWNRPILRDGPGPNGVAVVPGDARQAGDPDRAIASAGIAGEGDGAGAALAGISPPTPEPSPDESAASDPAVAAAELPEGLAADQVEFLLDLVDLDRSRTFVIEPTAGVSAGELAEELNGLLRDTLRADRRYGHLTAASDDAPADLFLLAADPAEQTNLLRRLDEAMGDHCRVVEPEEADRPGALLPIGDAGRLLVKTIEDAAPLRSGQERLLANRGHDHEPEAAVSHPRVIAPPPPQELPGPPPRPRQSPERVEGAAVEEGPTGVIVFWVRSAR
ncbi:hypothetical protein AB1L88_23905 [Tautonia sp. JC769]|uniref:anti-sigma factor family protein n=1 Tax=Tautonia sp. JC769 TaxID=3232135 RepID=UPI00345B0159